MTDEQQPNAPAGNGQTPEGDNPFGGLSLEWVGGEGEASPFAAPVALAPSSGFDGMSTPTQI